jgi:hypothetical protein
MIKKLAVFMFIIDIFIYVFLKLKMNSDVAFSFLFCAGILWINLVGLALIWKFVISFHLTGLAVLFTFIKYPLIGFSIFWASKQQWINSLGIVIGICAFLIIIVLSVLLNKIGKTAAKVEII